jgi:hypothetical protein
MYTILRESVRENDHAEVLILLTQGSKLMHRKGNKENLRNEVF